MFLGCPLHEILVKIDNDAQQIYVKKFVDKKQHCYFSALDRPKYFEKCPCTNDRCNVDLIYSEQCGKNQFDNQITNHAFVRRFKVPNSKPYLQERFRTCSLLYKMRKIRSSKTYFVYVALLKAGKAYCEWGQARRRFVETDIIPYQFLARKSRSSMISLDVSVV